MGGGSRTRVACTHLSFTSSACACFYDLNVDFLPPLVAVVAAVVTNVKSWELFS